ncbi:XRE family transcriptional regulator [Kingella negevensis]|uniref:Putative HTH-type transcriptional regulator n=3 Tax=Kingella TaxID=32257 RepID=A0A238TGF6_9NEIS|nr:XRE family transcriptional regulator [Kingella negevensis]MDK4680156.1 XRE family transcriptional regulator [Kingella negevensis]MDK4682124.1 XRE family transcriptional regulator [Kingella negevensis]MDK4690320.1 XRE family transcriptional regulator [Kingella negevensis]MDK4692333.1 XRE family transcriptional regulator [Kingella negevensis]MDK4696473.1 XRE family transcriptional regulator [Kingella negevensis]
MSFNERVKNRRLELGLSQAALGKLAGVPQSTIGQIENGRNKSSTKILELAHALQTTVEYLVDGVEPAQKQPSLPNVSEMPTPTPLYSVPIISWVQAGSWQPVELFDDDDLEYIVCRTKLGKDGYALRVRGDSMQPEFTEGDIIVIDPHGEPRAGSFVIALHDNETTFKQLVFDGSRPMLRPLNSNYPYLQIKENDRILGVVKEKVKLY